MSGIQKAPRPINSINELPYNYPTRTATHGYCHARYNANIDDPSVDDVRWDVYAQIDGEEILLDSNLSGEHAAWHMNNANAAIHIGDVVIV